MNDSVLSEESESADAHGLADQHQFSFTGTAREYFGIWIVNVLLTALTLGVYGAWAKVRDKKYMYGNTILDGHSFDYHATGPQILRGRIILFVGIAILTALSYFQPTLYLIVLFLLLPVLPFLVVLALRFNARMSSYRNVRFNFSGEYGEAFSAYVALPLVNVVTLYMITPLVSRRLQLFTAGNHEYGDRPFEFQPDGKGYYPAFWIALLLGLIAIFCGVGVLVAGGVVGGNVEDFAANYGAILIAYVILLIAMIVPASYYRVRMRNLLFRYSQLDNGQHRFESNVVPQKYVWIVFTNLLATIFSLGLAIPWAKIRLSKYLASVTSMHSSTDLDGYSSDIEESAGAMSAEYADMEGIGIDLGI